MATSTEVVQLESSFRNVSIIDEIPEIWTDVTDLLASAAADMEPGQMIESPSFRLHEAMSAMEVMDPKFDAGMHPERACTLDVCIELGKLPQELSSSQLLGIMDRLFVCEQLWLSGTSIAQTIFTCLYLHRLKDIADPILSAFGKTLLKTCEIFRLAVIRSDVHQEEDFVTHLYSLSLADDIEQEEILSRMKDAEERLLEVSRKCKAKLAAEPDAATTLEFQQCDALLARIRLRRALLQIQQEFERNSLSGVKKYVTFALTQLPLVQQSIALADSDPPGFDTDISRFLLPSAPPRVVNLIDTATAFARIHTMLQQLTIICTVQQHTKLYSMLTFMEEMGFAQLCLISRVRLALAIAPARVLVGKVAMAEAVSAAMLEHGVAKHVVEFPVTRAFIEKCVLKLVRYMRIFCANRSRQHRMLANYFDELNALELEVYTTLLVSVASVFLRLRLSTCKSSVLSWAEH
eukprot:TRINITY_DN1759_c1_g1_i1.p1 TRINITY_DN1759_c1_g1~~TRINITY_DN1759_c1_g1_i1.p1  ORF type:complete len:472 (-),score=91.50 TRINITY_DN1759_c1_g1_i1:1937-3325(-)